MKLIISIVQDEDSTKLQDELVKAGFRSTKISSTGGFLRRGNTTFITGVEDDRVEDMVGLVRDTCRKRTVKVNTVFPAAGAEILITPYETEVEVGGATVFVLDVERNLRL